MMFGQWHGSTAFGKWFGGLQADVVPFVEEQFHVFTEVFASWVETSNAVFVVDTALAASSLFAPAAPVATVMSDAIVTQTKCPAQTAETPRTTPKVRARKKSATVPAQPREHATLTETKQLFIVTGDRSETITLAPSGAFVKTK
jgi:hypothetical protein